MAKFEKQVMLVSELRLFTGPLPPGYASEIEFFVTTFLTLSEHLAELQQETLNALCRSFVNKLDAGKATHETIADFKASMDRLISDTDFKVVSAAMAGSREYLKQKISALKPLSLIHEEKKTEGRDPEAERRIKDTYSRLNYAALLKKVEAAPSDLTANAALAEARKEVAGYCGLYRVPLGEADTLTPFSLSCVDAALTASYRLFKNIRKATGRAL